ncbi:glycoside hydrolase 43 family protein [Litoribacter alkaliphilus]|uniref:Glycoside hydrolase 43 family protein n=1 Tax=Litoribacter ruber TaxID=702568 RepID=A0AAP2CF40_9BACT|nr:glycoside hydrolase 43 family protein [Litoribacter alkaliphilus]MBS9522722.1 glycoside hydrolase 43 family protein [Litoribacter alkaliphilus]
MNIFRYLYILLVFFTSTTILYSQSAANPVIYADVPDMSIIKVGDNYYMSSTTMHLSPGVPIMKSKDLVNWQLVNYAYDILEDNDVLTLEEGKNAYGRGSWASSLRFHEGRFYVSTFSQSTSKTHIFFTDDIENGPWERVEFSPSLHDHTLFFDNGKNYIIWGNGVIKIAELQDDLSDVKPGSERILLKNASLPAGDEFILEAEGSQIFKIDNNYYLMNIAWPKDGMRTVIIHKSDKLEGPYEGRLALQDKGVAQGGLIQAPNEQWMAYLFQDNGAVGRTPYLVPVTWVDGWPVFGIDGKVPLELDLPENEGLISGIVASDDFKRSQDEPDLPLVWQWNHNPVEKLWSIDRELGVLKMQTDRVDSSIYSARNTLTQRTIGPESMATTKLNISGMKNGDVAGLTLFQQNYGFIGVRKTDDDFYLINQNWDAEEVSVKINTPSVWVRARCDFKDRNDIGYFDYSLDEGESWEQLGEALSMKYTLPHFMGYRYGLFYYSSSTPGGQVEFGFFDIKDSIEL